ncbi:MAG: glycoside hydrolase family 3 C-terminal domain-containing protein [Alphaproteobacteria bacterium]|nr:glycoside hydrolase family 3 C-terminal domain-containing protein [Alphaproteobacteria bacterium]
MSLKRISGSLFALALLLCLVAAGLAAGSRRNDRPWMDRGLSPDARARLVVQAMTEPEKIQLLSSTSVNPDQPLPLAGLIRGIDRLGIPAIKETNAGLGIAIPFRNGHHNTADEATALPSGLAIAATWSPDLAYAAGSLIGSEARAKGLNVVLGGAANLARDPRNGRNFEYAGEDPLLTGSIVGEAIRGIGDRHVISTMKHFAVNDQETNRSNLNAVIEPAALRESDLLAFEIANQRGHPGAVMCSYNRVNGTPACENDWLLNRILRKEWGFDGWVMSDWGAVHSTARAAQAGLDQQSGVEWDGARYFGEALAASVKDGAVPGRQVDEMAQRVLRSLFAAGVVDDKTPATLADSSRDAQLAQHLAERGIVLLKNSAGLLPLAPDIAHVAVIGGHADIGVMSGGGSSQVIPAGGPALQIPAPAAATWTVFDPSSPLNALAAKRPQAHVDYASGDDLKTAAALARTADVAIVFATKWEAEGHDSGDLSLPADEDALIDSVAAANPKTIVVLETGNPVRMPWKDKVAGILEAWYPGQGGGEAIANILVGNTEPAGRLPITFPAGDAQLPRPEIPGYTSSPGNPIDVDYREGAAVGYKWFDARRIAPLFPFGFGLSYTSFAFHDLSVTRSEVPSVSFTVTNTGLRRGSAVPQLYAWAPGADGQVTQRLVGWRRVDLAPGQTERVDIEVPPLLLAGFDAERDRWQLSETAYPIAIGASAGDTPLTASLPVAPRELPP